VRGGRVREKRAVQLLVTILASAHTSTLSDDASANTQTEGEKKKKKEGEKNAQEKKKKKKRRKSVRPLCSIHCVHFVICLPSVVGFLGKKKKKGGRGIP